MHELYRRKIAELEGLVERDDELALAARETIRSMITRVTVSPAEGETGYHAVLEGDLAAIVSGVQRRMPGTNSAELTNYLISDYCALVKDRTDLSDSAKSSAVETFAAEVTRVLY